MNYGRIQKKNPTNYDVNNLVIEMQSWTESNLKIGDDRMKF